MDARTTRGKWIRRVSVVALIYFAHTFPHQPLFASEGFAGKSRAGKFGDAVEEIDWSLGEKHC
ncbi:MAG: hypothetical protein JRJ60_16920 [Deltaproteobacteria bacterium]|nr:hypothetical protein [Deltaproteobacteria bacterium]